MASIKDIAKACGVSVATVSKALNGHNDISQATKEKVREAAKADRLHAKLRSAGLKNEPYL